MKKILLAAAFLLSGCATLNATKSDGLLAYVKAEDAIVRAEVEVKNRACDSTRAWQQIDSDVRNSMYKVRQNIELKADDDFVIDATNLKNSLALLSSTRINAVCTISRIEHSIEGFDKRIAWISVANNLNLIWITHRRGFLQMLDVFSSSVTSKRISDPVISEFQYNIIGDLDELGKLVGDIESVSR